MAKHKRVNLKRKPSEDENREGLSLPHEQPEAFFPLHLYIGSPEVEKLGLSGVKVGEEHDLEAKVKVTSVSVNEDEGSERTESVTLTLLEGEVFSEHGEEDRAKKLFDGK